jgi:MFS family permease
MFKLISSHFSLIFFYVLAILLISKTFYNLIVVLKKQKDADLITKTEQLYNVELIRPLIFVKYFATCFTIPFLSQYILNITLSAGFSNQTASFAYVIYQVFFMLMIIPSGYIMEFGRIKRMLFIFFLLEALTYFILGITHSFWVILAVQIMFGIIIPISSSAEYAYILAYSTQQNRGEALALYSNTTKGAMISGIFLGGVLASSIGPAHTLLVSGLLITACLFYIIFILPKVDCKIIDCSIVHQEIQSKSILKLNFKKLLLLVKDLDFMRTILLVAFPIGILRDGIFLFSLPIILTYKHIPHEIIGQIMVLFSIGFFITNKYISKKADLSKNEPYYLFLGLMGSALALFMIAGLDNKGIYLLSIGLLILGLFRGFLLSPSMSFISKGPSSLIIGKNVSISIFRLFQVLGQIAGPILVAFLLSLTHHSSFMFAIIGGLCLGFAILFKLFRKIPHFPD